MFENFQFIYHKLKSLFCYCDLQNETALEAAMSKILKGEKKEMAELKKKDEDLEFPLTFEEMMEKKKELAKFRAKMSYQEAKARRQNKIKSKK